MERKMYFPAAGFEDAFRQEKLHQKAASTFAPFQKSEDYFICF